jgi:opacity protein-like surface antigen
MKKALLLLAIGLLANVSAHAQLMGPGAQQVVYGGVSLGGTYYPDYTGDYSSLVAYSVANAKPGIPITAVASQDRADVGAKLYVGDWFTNNLGAEFGYAYLGKTNINVSTTGIVTIWNITQENQAAYLDALIGTKLQNQSRIFLKLGAYSASISLSVSAIGPAGAAGAGLSSSNSGFHFGAGIDYPVANRVNVRFEAEEFNQVGDRGKTGQGDIGLFTVGLDYRFF